MRDAILIIIIVAVICVVALFALSRPGGEWRDIETAFAGITNAPGGPFAVISIANHGDRAVILRDHLGIGYEGIPSDSGGNLRGAATTDTNLVINASTQADFLIPIPRRGDAWIAQLAFVPVGLATEVRERLIRTDQRWAWWVLGRIGLPFHMEEQAFSRQGTIEPVTGPEEERPPGRD